MIDFNKYVEAQRQVNGTHLNGRVENEYDQTVGDFAVRLAQRATSVLVIGCRTGYECLAIQQAYPDCHVEGVDIVPEFVAEARSKGVEAYVGDMHELPFEDGQFDLVICIGTFEHAHDPARVAKEIMRVCRRAFVTADLGPDDNESHFTHHDTAEQWMEYFRLPHTAGRAHTWDKRVELYIRRVDDGSEEEASTDDSHQVSGD